MPLPFTPQDVEELIPGTQGSFCEKFNKSLGLGYYFWLLITYMAKEDGTFTDEFKADVCGFDCATVGGGADDDDDDDDDDPTATPKPRIFATDSTHADKIALYWDTVDGAISFDLYRNTSNNFSTAQRILEGVAGTVYEDTTVEVARYYWYWVVANYGTKTMTSDPDRGNAGTIDTGLDAITDLRAGTGLNYNTGEIPLMWTKVTGATMYDIYWSEEDNFTGATRIRLGVVPYDNSLSTSYGQKPWCLDNGTEILYLHNLGLTVENWKKKYYFWVVARRDDPPARSDESNSAAGWSVGFGDGDGYGYAGQLYTPNNNLTIGQYSKMWVCLRGAGGGGAGGGTSYGGGGGGGAGMICGWMNVVPGAKLRVRNNPNTQPAKAASATDGADGPTTLLEYSASGNFATDNVVIATIPGAEGGKYSAGGSGAGGAKSVPGAHSLSGAILYDGVDGLAGNGSMGGRSGYRFGSARLAPAHFNWFLYGTYPGDSNPDGNTAGSGSVGSSGSPSSCTGGKGANGLVVVCLRA